MSARASAGLAGLGGWDAAAIPVIPADQRRRSPHDVEGGRRCMDGAARKTSATLRVPTVPQGPLTGIGGAAWRRTETTARMLQDRQHTTASLSGGSRRVFGPASGSTAAAAAAIDCCLLGSRPRRPAAELAPNSSATRENTEKRNE
ncbi:hypothetical protein MRX96_005558 [Rhipicephalus microplus]